MVRTTLRTALLLLLDLGLSGCPNDKDETRKPDAAELVPPGRPSPATSEPSAAWPKPGAGFLEGSSFSILLHADTPHQLLQGKRVDRETDVHLSLPRMRRGQLAAFAFALYVDKKFQKQGAVPYCRRVASRVDEILREHRDILRPALSTEDFRANWVSGHASLYRTMEGSWCLQGRVDSLDTYYSGGFRMVGLTWQDDHDFATSWTYSGQVGLTSRGKDAVRRMNGLGIAVDVSHMSDRAIEDALAVAKAPVFASHSNARAICDHPRNLKDEHIRRIAATGGVVGINLYDLHLRKKGNATMDDVIKHIRHVRDVGGLESVALGSDFDGIDRGPKGLETAAELPNLRKALKNDGFSNEEIAAIFGGNFLRAFKKVEANKRATN